MQLLHLIAATVALPDTLPAPSTYLVNGICWALHSPTHRSSLHREALRAYTATRTRAGAALQLQNQAYPTTKGVYLGG